LARLNAFPVNRASTVSTTLASTAQRAPIKARQANRIALAAMQASTPLESDLLMRPIVHVVMKISIKPHLANQAAAPVSWEPILMPAAVDHCRVASHVKVGICPVQNQMISAVLVRSSSA